MRVEQRVRDRRVRVEASCILADSVRELWIGLAVAARRSGESGVVARLAEFSRRSFRVPD